MREILFRGQTRRRGEKVNMRGDKLPGQWVYGGVLQGTGDYSIIYGGENLDDIEKHSVYTDTIGQYTGLTDKKGVKIFDGDIIKQTFEGSGTEDQYEYDFYGYKIGIVAFRGTGTHIKSYRGKLWIDGELVEGWEPKRTERIAAYRCEVIGNIHDSPELLGGDDDE